MPIGELTKFLMDYSKNSNMVIYIDFFIDKNRDKIVKYTPNGTFSFLTQKENIVDYQLSGKNKQLDVAMRKVRDFAQDEKKIDYIVTATDALINKKSRDKLRIMLDAIDMVED